MVLRQHSAVRVPISPGLLAKVAVNARRRVLRLAAVMPVHLGAALSVVDILVALRAGVLRGNPDDPHRDRLVLSKGHGAFGLYAVLAELGVLDEPLDTLPGHPGEGIRGVDAATGALGHGLSLGVGMALGARLHGTGGQVAVVTGDGELNEGTNWEAAMFAAHQRLNNLVVVVDRNRLQQEGDTEHVLALEPLADKWSAFGWAIAHADGHDVADVVDAVDQLRDDPKPGVVIARTIKGHGVSFLAGNPAWHIGKLSEEQLALALGELVEAADR